MTSFKLNAEDASRAGMEVVANNLPSYDTTEDPEPTSGRNVATDDHTPEVAPSNARNKTMKKCALAFGATAAVGVAAGVGAFVVSSRNPPTVTVQLQKMSKSNKECYFGPVTESYIKGSTDNPVTRDGNQYYWGVNAVCKDPSFAYDPNVRGTASYCNDKFATPQNPNAEQVGSARGHCFVSPTQFGNRCDTSPALYDCEWNCEEVLEINQDYLFFKYLFQDDGSSVGGSPLGYPRQFEVIVTGGTGCYQNVDNAIIPGYTEYYDTYYYTYDLSSLKKN